MLNERQYEQLLKPLNPSRVEKRSQAGRSLSYLQSWDVKAHLIRIFGFGGWSADVIDAALAFEEQNEKGQWNVGYRVQMTLRIPSLSCSYTEVAVGSATLPQRGEAHDMAVKTAESDALKRAAINLGTQFGLSLYDNGSTKDVIQMTLDRERPTVGQTEPDQPAPSVTDTSSGPKLQDTEGAAVWYEQIASMATDTTMTIPERLNTLIEIKKAILKEDVGTWVYNNATLSAWMDRAVAAVTASAKKNGESK